MSKANGHHPETTPNCLNCGAETSANFCANCGQETTLHMPSAGEFLHEFVGHYVALESKLLGTLGRLLFRPGALTNEYIAGRRVRYVQPLRLYLSLSILFFAIIKFGHPSLMQSDPPAVPSGHLNSPNVGPDRAAADRAGNRPAVVPPTSAPAVQTVVDVKERAKTSPVDVDVGDNDLSRLPQELPSWLKIRLKHFFALPKGEREHALSEGFFHYAPYAVFCMMPLFALYLKVLYLGSGRRYGEHLLFALHSNAFAFCMLTLFTLSPWKSVKALLLFWMIGYLPLAMRRVYRRGRFSTLCRWFLLITAYSLTLLLAMLGSLALPMLA